VDNPAPRQDTRSQAAVGKQVWEPDGQAASERGVHTGPSARAWLHVRAGCSSGSRGRWKGRPTCEVAAGRWHSHERLPHLRCATCDAGCVFSIVHERRFGSGLRQACPYTW